MNRSHLLVSSAIVLCHVVAGLLATVSCPALSLANDRPNVLFIAIDDLRPALGCYGDTFVQSPHIDRLARRGLVMERAYCQQAVCSPSRSSVMTGTRPDSTKVWDLKTHFRDALPNVVTLGQHFRQHGYFVQGMGKIFHSGYDDEPTWSVPWQQPDAPTYALAANRAANKEQPESGDKPRRRGPAFESTEVADNYYRDGKVADLAIETLRQWSERQRAEPASPSKQPFFLAVGFSRPHLPFVAPRRYADLYASQQITLASNPFRPRGAPDFSILDGGELRNYQGIPDGPLPDDLARQLRLAYYACVSYLDAQVGRVLEELARLDLARDTVVILWSDHGWKLGEHQAWCKHSNTELDTRVPLILAVPGRSDSGLRTRALVELVDIYPTLSELAGLPLPDHLEGTSFAPLLDDPDRPWKKAAFSQYPRSAGQTHNGPAMGYSLRTDRYRFTRWVQREAPHRVIATELYDHAEDPDENTNLAADPAMGTLLSTLNQQMDGGWRAAVPPSPAPTPPRDLQGIRARTVPLEAFPVTPGVNYKDPSNIVRHADRYWMYFTLDDGIQTHVTIHGASSSDGIHWQRQGEVLGRGPEGAWDESGTLAPFVVPHADKFYLFYTGFRRADLATRQLGCAVADHPAGPWKRVEHQPILRLPDDANAWDSGMLGDSNVVYFAGQWRLYYKSRRPSETARDTRIGLATSDRITGPYERHPANPLFTGHAFSLWPHGEGLVALSGLNNAAVQWSADGVRFAEVATWPTISTGLFTPAPGSDPEHLHGFAWGLSELRQNEGTGLVRFDRQIEAPAASPRD